MSGFSSSHPAELSLKLLSIFKTSFSETGSKMKSLVLLVTIYSVGHFFDEWMFLLMMCQHSQKSY